MLLFKLRDPGILVRAFSFICSWLLVFPLAEREIRFLRRRRRREILRDAGDLRRRLATESDSEKLLSEFCSFLYVESGL